MDDDIWDVEMDLASQSVGSSEIPTHSPRDYRRDNRHYDQCLPSNPEYWDIMHKEEYCKEDMLIDNSFVGRIIGRGGSKIKQLKRDSEAYIEVLNSDSATVNRTIRLAGKAEAVEKAKQMINDIIDSSKKFTSQPPGRKFASQPVSTPVKDDFVPIDWEKFHIQSDKAREEYLASLPPIVKNFYKEDPKVAAMTKKDVASFRAQNNSISVLKIDADDDRVIPNPVTTFSQAFQHYPELLEELRKQEFTTPSPIQCQAWPIIMKGYDLIGIAQTGTGKTIAFLFPALIHLIGQVTPREKRVGPSVLILAPTRELAQQIEVEAKKYTYRGIKSICIYGGGNRRDQIANVKGVDIVIATPGRLNDLVMNDIVNVSGVTYLVLDEADRMLDLGFEPQIRKIVIDIRPDRQTIMTSATWTNEIQELAERYMTKPMKVNIGALDLAAVHTVTQEVIFGNDDYDERRELLNDFIASMGPEDKAIVFVERKSIADDISSDLILGGLEVQSIHGDREQYDREQALDDLKTGRVKILIATDVASRGLDIKDITLIFNLYFPHNIEEYVHRVGRTGRAGRTGKAISVFTRKDWMHAEGLIKILQEADQFVPEELYEMAQRYKAWKKKKTAEDIAAGGRRGRNRRY